MFENISKKKNKIGIVLLKERFSPEKISTSAHRININLDDSDMELYSGVSFKNNPKFVKDFFLQDKINDLYSSSARAILVVKNVIKNKDMIVTFGNGKSLLGDLCIEQDFGIRTAMNLVDPNNIKNISKVTLDSNPANSRMQRSLTTNSSEFDINADYDLAKKISGKIRKEYSDVLGDIVEGGGILSIKPNCDFKNIRAVLKEVIRVYEKNDYVDIFPWAENARLVADKKLIKSLDNEMLKTLKSNERINHETKVWASAPEFLDLERIEGYVVGESKKKTPTLNLTTNHILESLRGDFQIESLKSKRVHAVSIEDGTWVKSWQVYKCIYAEICKDRTVFILVEGGWYRLKKDFVEEIDDEYRRINLYEVDFPSFDPEFHPNENSYNKALAETLHGQCIDAKNIYYGGSYNKIEVCDVLTDEALIHCKIYGKSSVLSHLFQQGLNSGQLLKTDNEFEQEAIEQFKNKYKETVVSLKRKTIVYCIIAKTVKDFEIPFFSKISICNAKRNLEALGYKVYLKIVKQV